MNILNKYKVVIAIVLPILILVLIRSFESNHFKSDAKRWAEPSVMRSNIIPVNQIGSMPGEKMIISLGAERSGISDASIAELLIPADSILSKSFLKTIRKHNGPILLFSTEEATSSRIWMFLSQMGFKNLYILTGTTDIGILKYKFRPDTLVRPEL